MLISTLMLVNVVNAFTFTSSDDEETEIVNIDFNPSDDSDTGTVNLIIPPNTVSLNAEDFIGQSINISKMGPGLETVNRNHTGIYEHPVLEPRYYKSLSLNIAPMTEVTSTVEIFISANGREYISLGPIYPHFSASNTYNFNISQYFNGLKTLQFRIEIGKESTAVVTNVSIDYDLVVNAGELNIKKDENYFIDKYVEVGTEKSKSMKLLLTAQDEDMRLDYLQFGTTGLDGYAQQINNAYLYDNFGNLLGIAVPTWNDGTMDFYLNNFVIPKDQEISLEVKLDISLDAAKNIEYVPCSLYNVQATGVSSGIEKYYDLFDRGIGSFQWLAKSYAPAGNLFLEFFGTGGVGMTDRYFIDASGKKNDAVCNDEVTCPMNEPEHYNFHYSANFDGVDDYLTIKNSTSLKIQDAITIETWIKPFATSSDASDWMIIGSKGLSYELTVSKKGVVRAGIINELNKRVILDVNKPEIINNWTHLVMTYDGSDIKLYMNGILVGTKSQTGKIRNIAGDLLIGKHANTYHFNGMIDEFYVYDKVLDASVVLEHYNESPVNI